MAAEGSKTKYGDEDYIREIHDRLKRRASIERHTYERDWFRNILFYLGIQWITYSNELRRWKQRTLKKWVPRPVTNKFAMHANTIMQVLTGRPPESSVRGATDEIDDIEAGEVAQKCLPSIYTEAEADFARSIAGAWLVFTGNAFIHPCYDPDPRYGTIFIQHQQCLECGKVYPPDELLKSDGACLKCQNQTAMIAAEDESGNPIGEHQPKGKLAIDVFSPFEVYLDFEARSMKKDIEELMVRRRYPLEATRSKYPDQEIQPDSSEMQAGSISQNYLRAIAYAGVAATGIGYGSIETETKESSVTLDYFWKKPCEQFPDGLVAVFANDKLLNSKPEDQKIPYHDRKGRPIWNWHHLRFDIVPGRLLGRTVLDDLAPKQTQRNRLESMIELIIMRGAGGVWLKPKGAGITQITGDPYQIIEGNWLHDPRAKPERVPGDNVPSSVMAWLEKIDSDMEQLAGTFDVLRGNAPQGVSAGTALRLLLERAITRFTPVLKEIEQIWEATTKDLLTIAQQYMSEERLARVIGTGSQWEIMRYSAADIEGELDVQVEAGSAAPKSSVGDQALINDLVTMGAIDPKEPQTNYKILTKFGATHLLGVLDSNIKHAKREAWNFVKQGIPPHFDPIVDDHAIHFMEHKEVALSSDFETWEDARKAIWIAHMQEHQSALMAQQTPPLGGEDGKVREPLKRSKGNGAAGPPLPSTSIPAGENEMPPAFPGGL